MKRKQVELLAPAGNKEAFYGAMNAGADAIYLGGNKFGARAYADNFSTDDILKCIHYAHLMNRKVYLTVNTLVKDKEFDELREYLMPLYDARVDALIIQDLGVFQYVKECFPEMELHASTQMTLCSGYGAKLLKELGATRIVPARELSLNELISIKKNIDIEIETFIHGAMCYCYSGQCLFSSILGGRSGNRGRCAQPCRLPYSIKKDGINSKEAYYLSLKDMCTIENIPELIHAGIDSFKIEGRMKKPEYAAGVTSIYRKYIDQYYELITKYSFEEAIERFHIQNNDLKHLKSLYIRSEIQNGYYFKNNGREMITLKSPAYNGNDEKLLESIQADYIKKEKKLPICIYARFETGVPAELHVTFEDIYISVFGNIVDKAMKQPITQENIVRQLQKLGETVFCCEKIDCDVSENAFYPLKMINDLRRQAIDKLENEFIQRNGYESTPRYQLNIPPLPDIKNHSKSSNTFSVSIETKEQYLALRKWIEENPDFNELSDIYLPCDLLLFEQETINSLKSLSSTKKVFISFPYIFRERTQEFGKRIIQILNENTFISGVLVRTIDQLAFMLQQPVAYKIRTDAGVYVWNQYTVSFFRDKVDSMTLPYELNSAEQKQLVLKSCDFEKIIYSRIPMMITANCVMKTSESCRKHETGISYLKDRFGKEFPVVRNCHHCYNVIYNSVPLYLTNLTPWQNNVRFRIDFTIETENQVKAILDSYLLNKNYPIKEYTTGHEKRGVE